MLNLLSKIKFLPITAGVYLFKNKHGQVIYIGKAANLRRRVSSYWQKNHGDLRLQQLISEVSKIYFRITSSVIEALILEAELIKKYQPKFNIRAKDNKSFLYAIFTYEKFPKPLLIRGNELEKLKAKSYKLQANFGPFVSAGSIRAALHILRKIFPYSTCESRIKNQKLGAKPCFDYQIGLCPGVCIGAISGQDYLKNIRNLILFFRGKKQQILRNLRREMKQAAKIQDFEQATKLRNQIFALEHIKDTALIQKDNIIARNVATKQSCPIRGLPRFARNDSEAALIINVLGRIEGYDISNISGTAAVGSMVVFQNGEPIKEEYRKFKIKTVKGANDVRMLKEVLQRRLKHSKSWAIPNFIVIDGGIGQVNATREILKKYNFDIPVIGIAKGFMRKQDRPVYDYDDLELEHIAQTHKDLLLQIRDEAHRFAISYHRELRSKSFISPRN